MTHPFVSILVPVYNVESYIERCARSVFEQTYDNLEYIFVDDASTDNSINVLRQVVADYPKCKNRISIIQHPYNKGLAATRNTLVKQAKGEFLFHVDSDDWVEANAIQLLIEKQQETDADIVSGEAVDYKFGAEVPHKDGGVYLDKKELLIKVLSNSVSTSIWRRLIRKSLYIDHRITVNEAGSSGEDYQVLPRLIYYADKVTGIDKVIYHYNIENKQSISNNFYNKVNSQLQNYISVSVITDFFSDKEQYLQDIVNGQNIRRLHFFMIQNFSLKNRQGYEFLHNKLLAIDKNEWHYINWDKPIKRFIETHFYLMTFLYPLIKRYFQCKVIAYKLIKK